MLEPRSGESSGRQRDAPVITQAQPEPETGGEKTFPVDKIPLFFLSQLLQELLLAPQLRPLLPPLCRGARDQHTP